MSTDTKSKMAVLPGLYPNFFDLSSLNESEYLQTYQVYMQVIGEHSSDVIYARQALPEKLDDISYGLPALEALKSLEDGWDGYDSPKPSDNVFRKARDAWDYITGLVGPQIGPPRATPGSSGSVAFSWKRGNVELELCICDEEDFCADWCVATFGQPLHSGDTTRIDGLDLALNQFLSAS